MKISAKNLVPYNLWCLNYLTFQKGDDSEKGN